MMKTLSKPLVAVTVAAGLLAACASPRSETSPPAPAMAATEASTLSIPLHEPRPGLYSAGQPASSDWAAIRAKGVATVINLRPQSELKGRDEAAEVRAAGMRYIEIPVADGASITRENARKLHQAIGAAQGRPVLVHCASGNRAGGLLALAMVTEHGMSLEQALDFGRRAGMKSTEAHVRDVLAKPAD